MNRKQRIVLWMGVVLVVMMGLFPPIQVEAFHPPWQNNFDEQVPSVATEYRYQFVGSDNRIFMDETGTAVGSEIGWAHLRLQWLAVVLVMFGFMFAWRNRSSGDGGGEEPAPITSPPDEGTVPIYRMASMN